MNEREAGEGRSGFEEAPEDQVPALDPREIARAVEGFARENPHVAVGAACALGFLLGGGLTPRLIGTLALLAGKRYVNETVRATMEGVLRDQLGRQGSPASR